MRAACAPTDSTLVSLATGVGLLPHFPTTIVTLQSLDTTGRADADRPSRAPSVPTPRRLNRKNVNRTRGREAGLNALRHARPRYRGPEAAAQRSLQAALRRRFAILWRDVYAIQGAVVGRVARGCYVLAC